MKEWFIYAHSFAAPFCSDTSHHFVEAKTPEEALRALADGLYKHPAGLYSAAAYASAKAFHKGEKPLARWLSNHAQAVSAPDVTMICSHGPGLVEINGRARKIENPKAGDVVRA